MLFSNNEIISPQSVLKFWFNKPANTLWFKSNSEFDNKILTKYHSLWLKAKNGRLVEWERTAEGCLALTIVLDQFPLNIFRGKAESFSTEADAIRIAHHAISRNFDKELKHSQLSFLYMPLMHSENIDDQNLSVKLFKKNGLDNNLRFAKHHREIIKKFGRFPHRNAILNRKSTPEELEYLNSSNAFTG